MSSQFRTIPCSIGWVTLRKERFSAAAMARRMGWGVVREKVASGGRWEEREEGRKRKGDGREGGRSASALCSLPSPFLSSPLQSRDRELEGSDRYSP